MIPIFIQDETSPLEAVVLGTAESPGPVPMLDDTYDPKSREHILAGTYPKEGDLVHEMAQVESILNAYKVKVYRPKVLDNYNQIFSRDIALAIDRKLIVPQITEKRKKEVEGIQHLIDQAEEVLKPESHERMEGGDVIVWRDHLFVGYSKKEDFDKYAVSRTNEAGVEFLKREFPNKKVKAFELKKSDTDPYENALHLDCCFQPVGSDKAVLYAGGFKNDEDVAFLKKIFGRSNIFEITKEEMYEMNANFFSISPEVVISDSSFKRLNAQLNKWGIKTEEVKYREVAKMEGLLRCSTLPLKRKYARANYR